ncbi:disintegrin and metalloproteinase domain-containing protein 33 [Protopterus annectens]|uniref:disintegrin and metalloproteinase domain-containing protein 33 n=1 Tax=Protopterus annectens TaxID=7888 RepID=UPI001CFB1A85|nr:disintegrin and metalloproteinase domain-containing protein 33 [Protopterus annectens]
MSLLQPFLHLLALLVFSMGLEVDNSKFSSMLLQNSETPQDVQGQLYTKFSTATNYTNKTTYPDSIHYTLKLGKKLHAIHLEKSQMLLSEDYTNTHYLKDGTLITDSLHHMDHCCYTGTVIGHEESFVSLCVCHGLSGYVTLEQETFAVEPLDQGGHRMIKLKILERSMRSLKWDKKIPWSSSPRLEWESSYNIELVLVADRDEFQRRGHDLEKTRDHLIELAHHLEQIYSQINIHIFLVGTVIWSGENEAKVTESSSETLINFLKWRKEVLLPQKHHDNVQLVSGKNFKDYSIGEAFLAKMCSPEKSGGIVKDTGLSTRQLALQLGHELGHNLGMFHDSKGCYCPVNSGKCLLSGNTGKGLNPVFSDCSQQFLQQFLQENNITCLLDRPKMFIPTEGNGKLYSPLQVASVVCMALSPIILALIVWIAFKGKQSQNYSSVNQVLKSEMI